jgi:hypothetical protein
MVALPLFGLGGRTDFVPFILPGVIPREPTFGKRPTRGLGLPCVEFLP